MARDVGGIVTVLNTPFTEQNQLDEPGLRSHVRYALLAGVSGFLVPALASETGLLSPDEKRRIVATVVEEAGGQAAVIAGASSDQQVQRLALAAEFLQLGADGVLVQLNAETPLEVLQRDLQQLADLQPEILMLQDWDASGAGIPVEHIVRLLDQVPRLNWLKIEVADAGPKYTQVLEATDGRLKVAGGWAVTQMLDGLQRGVHAFMPTGLHHTYVQICQAWSAGQHARAQQLFAQVQPVLAFSNRDLEFSIRFFKRLLNRQGIYTTDAVRVTGSEFGVKERQEADRLIQRVMELEGVPSTGAS